MEIRQDAEVPEYLEADRNALPSRKNVYGVIPPGLNKPETEFARMLDNDETGTVKWWLRNVSQARWAVSIVLPNGRSFFPDFVVGVDASRKTPDHIGLVEVKDDGETERMFASVNTEKVRTRHRTYSSALMVCKLEDEAWYRIVYRPEVA